MGVANSYASEKPDGLLSVNDECSVPCDEIVGGGPGKDGIPAIDNPIFINSTIGDKENHDNSIVIGINIDGKARAYPYAILNWHEITNDLFQGRHFSITYCPLTGSGILYKTSNLQNSSMGVSGKLYENNLVMYDRETDTYFSQMKGFGIKGDLMDTKLETGEVIETTWGAWKAMYPDTEILSRDTGYTRNYDSYPYGSYQYDQSIYFPSSYDANFAPHNYYHPKALTVVIPLLEELHLIAFDELVNDSTITISTEEGALSVFHDTDSRLSIVYESIVDNNALSFVRSSSSYSLEDAFGLPTFVDNVTGSIWNIKGLAFEGELTGTQLKQKTSYNAFWFATVTFFPEAIIHFVNGIPETVNFSSTSETDFYFTPIFLLIGLPIILKIKKVYNK